MNKIKLSDIAKITMGQSPAGDTCNGEGTGIPLLNGPAEFTTTYPIECQYTTDAKRLSEPGDILFCVRGSTTGRMNWSDKRYAIGRGLAAITHKDDKSLNFYIKYLIEHNLKALLNYANGSTFPNLTNDLLKGFELYVHDTDSIRRISDLLCLIDTKVEINNRINNELEAMAKTLYDYWFVQFDFPDANGKPYKASGGQMIYKPELKREIPKGWEVGKISDWIEADKTGDWGKESPEGNYTKKVYCIRGADINDLNGAGICTPPVRYILEKNSHKILEAGDLIVEISGGSPTQSTGRMAYLTEETLSRFDAPIICSNFCKAITLKEKEDLYAFAMLWKMLYDNGIFFGFEGKTSGIKNFLFESFTTSYSSVIPDKSVIQKFYNFMHPIQSKKQKALKENQELTELRDWLLPMLMNGQVTIAEAEEKVAMATEPEAAYGRQGEFRF